jgi:hypothetical protein
MSACSCYTCLWHPELGLCLREPGRTVFVGMRGVRVRKDVPVAPTVFIGMRGVKVCRTSMPLTPSRFSFSRSR